MNTSTTDNQPTAEPQATTPSAAAPAARKTARKAAAKSVPAKPAAKASPARKVNTTRTVAGVAAKPVAKTKAAAAKTKPAESKPVKIKPVRDSFTMPSDEYSVLAVLKQRAVALAHPVKKSELLRAGIKLLAGLSDAALLRALKNVPAIKTGRPKSKKGE